MKMRNPKIGKWRWLMVIALIASCVMVGMEFYLSDHALSPEQVKKEGQYCAVTANWMSDAFAVETMADEDTYDYFIVTHPAMDRFMIIKSWTDDEQCLEYIDALYSSGAYQAVEQEWTGGSGVIDQEVKALAATYLSDQTGENVTLDDFEDYFYPYCLDLTNMGDMDVVIGGMLLAFAVLFISLAGGLISAIRWRTKLNRLKNQSFYPKLEQNWMRSGEPMDTKKQPLVVVPGFLVVPSYQTIIIELEKSVWCYVLPLARKKYGFYVMDNNGKVNFICQIKESKQVFVRHYLEQMHLAAPWMAIGYSSENREAFGPFEKEKTINQIMEEKNKMLSQFLV